jgi:hypothetical protein
VEKGFDDATCVVVKTTSGNRSGITDAGGRYGHPNNSDRSEVIRLMREQRMEPPPPPFIVASGEYTPYRECGHHADRTPQNLVTPYNVGQVSARAAFARSAYRLASNSG